MIISHLKLFNFRNYDSLVLNPHTNINILVGRNAQGKTSLLESIYVLSRGRSYKNNIRELIKWDKDYCIIEGVFKKKHFSDKVSISITSTNKSNINLNGKKIRKKSTLLENFYTVLFSPEDLNMIKGGPDQRRKFIDNEISMIKPSYDKILKDYGKVLFQRNNLLKTLQKDSSNSDTLSVWDEQLIQLGKQILFTRIQYLKKINFIIRNIHHSLTNGTEELKLYYKSNMIRNHIDLQDIENTYRECIKQNLKEDIKRGYTSIGPHVDDINVVINDYDAKIYGSQGQQRTAALSLKLSEIEIIRNELGEDPIILLDDVMSELDLSRQEKIIDYFKESQVFITCTEINFQNFLENFDKKIYTIEQGKIV